MLEHKVSLFFIAYLNVSQNSKCRRGPSQLYPEDSFVYTGDRVKIVGKNPNGGWWLIFNPKKSRNCWVWDGAGPVSGDTSQIPTVDPPPPPTSEAGLDDVSVTQRECAIGRRFGRRAFEMPKEKKNGKTKNRK